MAAHEAQAYQDQGTPEEQSRRTFLANATLAVGGVIGLVLTVPLLTSLVPESLIKPGTGKGVPTKISDADYKALDAATNKPVKIQFSFKYQDGYLPPADDTQFVWGVKLKPEQEAKFKVDRADLFETKSKVDYPAVAMGFVVFSSICPHLGCRYNWIDEEHKFVCPCHGSQFDITGKVVHSPAPRGLDPLPLKNENGSAEITWIQYKSQTADRIIVSYS